MKAIAARSQSVTWSEALVVVPRPASFRRTVYTRNDESIALSLLLSFLVGSYLAKLYEQLTGSDLLHTDEYDDFDRRFEA